MSVLDYVMGMKSAGAGGGGGTGGSGLLVTIVGAFNKPAPDNAKFDKTAGEVISALEGNGSVRFVWHDPEAEGEYTMIYYLDDYGLDSEGVWFTLRSFYMGVQNSYVMSATSLDDYPQFYA